MYVEGTILLACCCDNYRDRVVVAQVSGQTNESNPKVFSCLGAGDFFVKVHKHQDNMQSRKRKNAKKEKTFVREMLNALYKREKKQHESLRSM